MLALMLIAMSAYAMQPGVLRLEFTTLFQAKDRSSTFLDTSFDLRAQLTLMLYNMGIEAMAVLTLFYYRSPGASFSFGTYAWLLLIAIVVEALKWLMQRVVAYTFFPTASLDAAFRHYYYLLSATCLMLFPVVLVTLFVPWMTYVWVLVLVILVMLFYYALLLVKLFMTFVHSIPSIPYVIFYLLTLEVMPLVGMLMICHWVFVLTA